MLNIPDEIKELIGMDSCQKNIRITFPNGERGDICNDLIVMDSVSFKESLCSQNTLKFGLCESPVFECETVGVENISGASIKVYCEIYCDPSVPDAEFKADIQSFVYAIPYGSFVVNSCKRQADMIHRRIVAYSGANIYSDKKRYNIVSDGFNRRIYSDNIEDAKNLLRLYYGGNYSYSWLKRIYNKDNSIGTEFLTELDSEEYHLTSGNYFGCYTHIFGRTSFPLAMFTVWGKFGQTSITTSNYGNDSFRDDNLYQVIQYDPLMTEDDIERQLTEFINNNTEYIYGDTFYAEALNVIHDFAYCLNEMQSIANGSDHMSNTYATASIAGTDASGNSTGTVNCPVMNPSYVYKYNATSNATADSYSKVTMYYLMEFYVRLTKYNTPNPTTTVDSDVFVIRDASDPQGIIKVFSTPDDSLRGTEERVLVADYSKNTKYTGYRVSGVWNDYSKALEAYAEMAGKFFRIGRVGEMDAIDIKQQFGLRPDTTLYPGQSVYPEGVNGGSILPSDYQTCWYDDGYMKMYGAIRCVYKDTNQQDNEYMYFLNGFDKTSALDTYNVYDISGNYIIQKGLWTESQIHDICEVIADSLDGVTYMPVDFTGRGLPYVEAGDTFEILTASNDSITTIVLNRTISGEMVLTDSYKSI